MTSTVITSEKAAIITLKGITREFSAGETKIRVLHDINLKLYQGEMVAIIGQSGSGKSTLMNILGCLDQASCGSYHIFGQSVANMSAESLARLRREHFGFIFQRYHLLDDISALDNVTVPAIYASCDTASRNARAKELLTQLGLGDKTQNRPNQLSGGQQQRVSIARALMNGGDIILADEPTGALDSHSGKEVMAILHRLKDAGHTIIMVTHDPNLAKQAQRVIELKDGCIIADYYTTPSCTSEVSKHKQDKVAAKIESTPNSDHHPVNTQSADRKIPKNVRKSAFLSMLDRLQEALKMSLYAMKAHKMRTLLTMLGIIIGIASVVSIVGLGQGTQEKILSDINALGTNTITVRDGYRWGDPRRRFHQDNLTIADSEAVAMQPYAKSVSPQVDASVSARFKNIETTAQINGVGQNYLQATGEKIAMGQMFDEGSIKGIAQEIIIDDIAYRSFFDGVGDPVGENIMVGNIPGTVIGVLQKNDAGFGPSNETPQLYMPYTTVMYRMLGTSHIERFVVQVEDGIKSSAAETAIIALLKSRHGIEDFTTMNPDAIRQTVESTTNAMTLLISSIAIISLIVGGIGVMNIMLVSVTERTNEIGVRMAVGARQSDIMQQFLIEAVLVCVLGGVLGIAFAFVIGEIINGLGSEDFRVVYSPLSIIVALICSTLIGILFGFLPARNAARLNPVDALAHN